MQIGMAMRKPSGITLAQRIRALFAAGEQGAWYDPADFSTMFQDSAGTTPVTAVGQPVGKLLDKSGRGNHATQATSTKRPTLQQDASGRYYLLFDGIDDALATGSIDFTATDKMTVVAGVRKLSDAAAGILSELSVNAGDTTPGVNSGSFYLVAPGSIGALGNYSFSAHGSAGAASTQAASSATLLAPRTDVITATGNISGDLNAIRANGTASGTTGVGDQGTGNFGAYPLYIGSRAGTSLPFNGHLYSLIVRGAQSTDAQIAAAEAYCNQKTGAY